MLLAIIQRLCWIPLSLIGMSLLVFALTRFLPGGPLETRLWQQQELALRSPVLSHEAQEKERQALVQFYRLDQPFLQAYRQWLGAWWSGDLGTSFRYQESVWMLIQERLPVSLSFGLAALLLGYGVAIVSGLILAFYSERSIALLLEKLLLLFYAIPSSVLGMGLFFFVARYGFFPIEGLTSDHYAELQGWQKLWDRLHHAFIPMIAYGAHQSAVLSLLFAQEIKLKIQSPVFLFARAKGLSYHQALWRHAVPLSLIPLLQQGGHVIGLLLSGSFIIERLFNLDGIGYLSFEALTHRDYPLVISLLTIFGLLHCLGNLGSDLLIMWADPRLRESRGLL